MAQSEVAALRKMAPSDEELTLAFRVSFDAVQSLIDWKRGSHQQAAESLKSAIHAAAELAARFGHGYLTGRRIYLATNMARIELSDGKVDQALYLCQALGEVIKGDASRWPFGAARSLSLPLSPLEEAFLQEHLDRLLEESLARGAWPADRTA